MSSSSEIHVIGCNVWSDYSADVIFDDGTAMVFGAGLDTFSRIRRINNGELRDLNFNQHNRLAIDIQQHYTGHALSRDVTHVGAALKVVSTLAPRPKFLRVAVKAVDGEDGIVHWKAMLSSMEEFVAPPLNGGADTANNIRVGPDGSVTVMAIAGNATLWLSANGTFFDVTWPARAYESDGRSIQFVSSSAASPQEAASATPGIHNTVKSILCVPLQQRFPVGLAIDAARRCSPPPSYRSESIDSHLMGSSFWAPLACWAPLLRVAVQTWKDRGGVCPESVTQFLSSYSTTVVVPAPSSPPSASSSSSTSVPTKSRNSTTTAVPHFEAISSNFPPPIPPKVNAVISPFPRISFEDAATLLASTADRLHSLPVHERVHTAAGLCVSWCAGDRACWLSPEPGIARSLIFEDMSCLHVEGLAPHTPIALLHIQNAVQHMAKNNSTGDKLQPIHQIVAAAKVYSWESDGSLASTARHAPLLPSCIVLPRDFTPCSVPDGVNIFLSRYNCSSSGAAGGARSDSSAVNHNSSSSIVNNSQAVSGTETTNASSSFMAQFAAAASCDPRGDPRRGRYLLTEVEFIASVLEVGRSSLSRAARHAPARSPALGLIATNNSGMADHGLNVSSATMKQQHHNQSMLSTLPGENIGSVRCSSVIPGVGTFTAYQDGTVRACFDDRTILSMKQESVDPTLASSFVSSSVPPSRNPMQPQGLGGAFSGENIFVTALDSRAISTRFRAAACTPQHPMYVYLQYAMPFLRYSLLPAEERAQLGADQATLAWSCKSDFHGNGATENNVFSSSGSSEVQLASQLERVVARSNLALQRHQEMSAKRRELLSKCEFQPYRK